MFPCLLLTSALALGDCSGAACAARNSGYTWHRFDSDPGRSYLYRDETLLAAYDHAEAIYRTIADLKALGSEGILVTRIERLMP